ncbi:MAG TPA: asparagine synthase (glutamine-hydrolyzing) [Solirubrobacteraceae bacterium]|jgi:asparagine synthase (glutamine-hydrolysing)|nr:asparagine synthase (glutamine-hydrolyzing) [Solirubrobacteraceae bacterium]
MCGICGSVQARPDGLLRAVQAQLTTQRHRGPDAEGWFEGGRAVIAQNRLSIIDLDTGDPPMTNESSTVGAVLNGEIYNFASLREGLAQRGHRFSSSGDTEALAHLAEESDAKELARALDGMFAFAVWRSGDEKLLLGRDRMGKKPLYYWNGGGTFVFASEIKGLLAHPSVPQRLDPRAISAYLTFGYVPTPFTFFEGIRSLPPAHVLTLEPGGEPLIERYWLLELPGVNGTAPLDIGLDEAASEVRRLLEAGIRRRLVSDVPLGAFLSGGIDSSAIVAMMAGVMGEPIKTFTIGFDDRDGFDERPFARAVAKQFGTEHHEAVAHPQTIELVERLVYHHDQPFGDSSAVPTFLLNGLAREHVTVALSGDGGDELFAGYERFAGALAVDWALRVPEAVRNAGERAVGSIPAAALRGRAGKAQRFAATVSDGLPFAYLGWVGYVPEQWRRRLLETPSDWARADYERRWQATRGARTLDRLLALNIDTYLVDDLLVKADRTSMAHGLEVRSPFLDTELVEFAARLKPGLKARGLSLKRVLKRAVVDLLPAEILSRPKRGFGVPLDRWFREDLQQYATTMLGDGARVRGHLRGDALDALLSEHQTGTAAHGQALWTLLTLELFLRKQGW